VHYFIDGPRQMAALPDRALAAACGSIRFT
jgi:hypothetical protein